MNRLYIKLMRVKNFIILLKSQHLIFYTIQNTIRNKILYINLMRVENFLIFQRKQFSLRLFTSRDPTLFTIFNEPTVARELICIRCKYALRPC